MGENVSYACGSRRLLQVLRDSTRLASNLSFKPDRKDFVPSTNTLGVMASSSFIGIRPRQLRLLVMGCTATGTKRRALMDVISMTSRESQNSISSQGKFRGRRTRSSRYTTNCRPSARFNLQWVKLFTSNRTHTASSCRECHSLN